MSHELNKETGATKNDSGKPQLSLLPASFWGNVTVFSLSMSKIEEADYRIIRALELLAQYAESPTKIDCLEFAASRVIESFPTLYDAATAQARAMEFGVKKYSRNNWRKGFADSRLLDAAMRHLCQFLDTPLDDESGHDHRGHALFEITALIDQIIRRRRGVAGGTDDLSGD